MGGLLPVLLFFGLCCWSVGASRDVTLDLSSFEWQLSNERGYNNVTMPGQVPGNVFTDLMAAGVLDDPYFRFNDLNYRWVSLDNWTYSTAMVLPSSVRAHSRVLLWFEGLDTVARILVNGAAVGHSNNMFRRYLFDIKPFLSQTGAPDELKIQFISSALYAEHQARDAGYHIPQSTYKVTSLLYIAPDAHRTRQD